MSIVGNFILKYKVDANAAKADLKKLNEEVDNLQNKNEKGSKKVDEAVKKSTKGLKDIQDHAQKVKGSVQGATKSVSGAFDALKSGGTAVGEAFSAMGVAAAATATIAGGIIAVVTGGVIAANSRIDELTENAKHALEFSKQVREMRLGMPEATLSQTRGRTLGLSDQQALEDTRSRQQKQIELIRAQRQNVLNPLFGLTAEGKSVAQWQKHSGALRSDRNTPAAFGDYASAQDKYIASLVRAGKETQAVEEAIQHMGYTFEGVQAIVRNADKITDSFTYQQLKEAETKQDLQKQSLLLQNAEQKLENQRKSFSEHLDAESIPAVIKYKESMVEFDKSLQPLMEKLNTIKTWFIELLTTLVKASSTSLATDNQTKYKAYLEDVRKRETGGEKVPDWEKTRAASYSFSKEFTTRYEKGLKQSPADIEETRRSTMIPLAKELASKFASENKLSKTDTESLIGKVVESVSTGKDFDTQAKVAEGVGLIYNQLKDSGQVARAQLTAENQTAANTGMMVHAISAEELASRYASEVGRNVRNTTQMVGEGYSHWAHRMFELDRTTQTPFITKAREASTQASRVQNYQNEVNRNGTKGINPKDVRIDKVEVNLQSSAQSVEGMRDEIGSAMKQEFRALVTEFANGQVS